MIFKNYKGIQGNFAIFTIRFWLFVFTYLHIKEPKVCLGLPNFVGPLNKLNENEIVRPVSSTTNLQNTDSNYNEDNFTDELNSPENRQACQYFQSSKTLMCNGSIDYAYLKAVKEEQIIDFIVENYEIEFLYKKKYWSSRNIETGEWYMKLPKLYQKLTGEVQLKNLGLQMAVNIRMLPSRDLKGFLLEGEVFSNKVIKISWILTGHLSLDLIKNRTMIFFDTGALGDSDWKIQSNLTFAKRNPEGESDSWKIIGIIKSDYVSENQFAFYKGTVVTKMMKEECKFFGEVKLPNADLEASLFGNVSPPQKKQITIPKSAFSNMTMTNIIFKDSNFYEDFEQNSFEGLRGVRKITFIDSKLDIVPKLDELFQNFFDLEEIYIEDCVISRLKFGSRSTLKSVQKLSFKGSGPLIFDDTSFLWLKNSNLTFLNLKNTHVKISVKTDSVLRSVNNTLSHLDVSYSTLNEEKDLMLILAHLNIISLKAEGLKLKKIPTSALERVRKSLKYLSLKENNFRKNFEKHFFDNVLNFPVMLNLVELNLEDCHINFIEKGVFNNLPNLKTLHLSYNNLENVQDGWTYVTPQITYLGLSHNMFSPRITSVNQYDLKPSMNLNKFKNLTVLDLSNGIFTNINALIGSIGSNLKNLSLQNTGLEDLSENFFENLTDLEILDLSYNRNMKTARPFLFNWFKKLKNLKSLDLKHCRIGGVCIIAGNFVESQNPEDFTLDNLQSLDLSVNNLKKLDSNILRAFPKLKILNLSGNSITEWSITMSFNDNLRALFLDENKIETITSEMLSDIKNLEYLKMGNNPFICGPYVYEVLKMTNKKEEMKKLSQIRLNFANSLINNDTRDFQESNFVKKIYNKTKKEDDITKSNNMKILDWSEENYICFSYSKAKFIPFTQVNENFQDASPKKTEKAQTVLLGLVIVIVVGLVIFVAIICWKCLDIHLITKAVRSAVALSFVSRGEKELTNFKYNVFVSYSDKDRSWVVENLIPRLESKNDVKVCLHERDFQVGLSIIENILNSIDNSRNIILVVSEAFLKSQWCQYEMQLAQFRLLEKGRDQLILIFLENIPAIKRPKALRYLMMTKTYLQWPLNSKNIKEIDNFWNRLMKSLLY